MKKKILIFMLLFLILAGATVPMQAAAADSSMLYVDIEDFLTSNGYESFDKNDDCTYFAYIRDEYLFVFEFDAPSDYIVFGKSSSTSKLVYALCDYSDIGVKYYMYYNPENAASLNIFSVIEEKSGYVSNRVTSKQILYKSTTAKNIWAMDYVSNVVYSDVDLCLMTRLSNSEPYEVNYDTVYFDSNSSSFFNFITWCNCAGLNHTFSSNESPTVIPYSFNSYWHIVRRNAAGQWLLTTIGNSVMSENISDYTLLQLDNGNLGVYSLYAGEDYNGYLLNVRQYIYDTDGWKVRTYDTIDVREDDDFIIDLGAGSGFDDYRLLAYTSSDIYSETGLDLLHPASTEYIDVTDTPVVPDEPDNPTSTPSNPSGGSGAEGGGTGGGTRPEGGSGSTVGGQAKPGGMLDFIITFFTMVWTKLFAVEVPVDGYQISFQAIVIFGVIAGVLIWLGKSSFGKKG